MSVRCSVFSVQCSERLSAFSSSNGMKLRPCMGSGVRVKVLHTTVRQDPRDLASRVNEAKKLTQVSAVVLSVAFSCCRGACGAPTAREGDGKAAWVGDQS